MDTSAVSGGAGGVGWAGGPCTRFCTLFWITGSLVVTLRPAHALFMAVDITPWTSCITSSFCSLVRKSLICFAYAANDKSSSSSLSTGLFSSCWSIDKIFSFRSFFCFAAGVKHLAFGACKCTLEATLELHEEELELVEAMQSRLTILLISWATKVSGGVTILCSFSGTAADSTLCTPPSPSISTSSGQLELSRL